MQDEKNPLPQDVYDLVCKRFNGDKEKTWRWFRTPNPSFGYIPPLQLVRERKVKKLINWALKQITMKI